MRPIRLSALLVGLAAAAALAPNTAARPADEFGTIKGQVVLENFPGPQPEPVEGQDKAVCLSKGALLKNVVIVDKKSKGLKNVVVYLRPDDATPGGPVKQFPKEQIKPELVKAAPKHHVVDQPCCQFEPRIVAARAGDTLEVKNTAGINHNINYGGEPGNQAFNVNVPGGGTKKLDAPVGVVNSPVPFKCDIHPWMAGRMRVFDHPYFATTDADGKFEIKDAPAGNWRLVYWHENGFHKGAPGRFGEQVTVAGAATEVPVVKFEFPKAK